MAFPPLYTNGILSFQESLEIKGINSMVLEILSGFTEYSHYSIINTLFLVFFLEKPSQPLLTKYLFQDADISY